MKIIIHLGLCSILLMSCDSKKDKKVHHKKPVALPPMETRPAPPPPGPRKPPNVTRRRLVNCDYYCANWKVDNDLNFNTMSFPNFGYLGIGRCRGHAIVTQKLSQLLVFKPSERCTEDSFTCRNRLIEKLRNALINFEVVEIPNYENLLELSQDFVLKQYLRGWVRGTPANFSARRSDVRVDQYTDPKKNLFFDIIQKIEMGMVPYLGILGSFKISSHALLATQIKYNEDGQVICVEDSNIVTDISTGDLCENYLYYDDLGQNLYYQKGQLTERLNYIGTYTDDEYRHQRYQAAWYSYCLDKFKGIACN